MVSSITIILVINSPFSASPIAIAVSACKTRHRNKPPKSSFDASSPFNVSATAPFLHLRLRRHQPTRPAL